MTLQDNQIAATVIGIPVTNFLFTYKTELVVTLGRRRKYIEKEKKKKKRERGK